MSDLGSSNYSEAAASNNQTPPNGWPEGMNPSSVNDSARENMAGTKRWYNKVNPTLTTGGTTTAYTLTSVTQAETAYYAGQVYSFVVNATCGASPSLNIDALGALSLRKWSTSSASFVTLNAGDLIANQLVVARYNSSAPGFFDIIAVSAGVPTDYAPATSGLPTGATMGFRGSTSQVPAGWVLERGNSIGDASSGATERANADTVNLFTLLWANTNYGLQNSSGTTVSRGASAAVDYAAHCRLVLPNMTNTFRRGDNSGTAVGASGGADTHTHTVSATGTNTTFSANVGTSGAFAGGSGSAVAADHTHNFGVVVTGTAASGSNIPAYVTELSIIKL